MRSLGAFIRELYQLTNFDAGFRGIETGPFVRAAEFLDFHIDFGIRQKAGL